MALTKVKAGNILLTTPGASSNDVTPATTAYVTTALANLADSAPSTLDTLNELAAALGDDANFSTTVTNSIAAKLPLSGGTMTGAITGNLIGNVTGNVSGTALTVTQAAQPAITSLGTLTTLTVDDITINGSAITVGAFGNTARAANFHGGSILVDGGAASEIIIGDGNIAYMSIQTTDNATAMKIRNFTGSADLVTIERATGKVGIGVTSPASKLHVESGNAHNKLSITSTASGGTGYDAVIDLLGSASNSEVQLNMGINGDADREQIKTYQSDMAFRTNNTERMRIQSNGGISLTGNHQFNFRATGLSNSGLGAVMVFDTVASGNAAGCYSTSSGMYQAAIDGWYMVSVGIRYDSITGSSGYARPQLRFLPNNGSTWLYPHNGFWVDPIIGTSTTNGSYMNCTYSVPMYLANGDNIQLIEQGASVTITHNHDESHFGVIFMG
jgi:hypothetical protein